MSLDWSVVVTAGAMLLGALAALCYLVVHLKAHRVEARWRARHADLEAELQAMSASSRQIGDRLLALEQEVRRLGGALNLLEMKRAPTGHYRHAITLASRGASAEELIASCGLARGEAELMQRLHGEHV